MITRDQLIAHILMMMQTDIYYARESLKRYNELLPDWRLNAGVREALKGQE